MPWLYSVDQISSQTRLNARLLPQGHRLAGIPASLLLLPQAMTALLQSMSRAQLRAATTQQEATPMHAMHEMEND